METITNQELDMVKEKLSESINETDKLLADIEKKHENDDNSNAKLEEGIAQFINDGTLIGGEELEDDDFSHFENINAKIDELIENSISENISSNYDLNDEEAIKFANLISNYRAKKNIKVFDELPKVMKEQVINLVKSQPPVQPNMITRMLEFTARAVLDELISDAELDSLSIDLDKAMKELIPDPIEVYSENNREYIEEEFPKVAESIKDKDPVRAENLMAMRQGYIDAYTYEPLYDVINNDSKINKKLRKYDVYWSRVKNDFFAVANLTKFMLYSLDDILKSLMNLGYTEKQAKRIIIVFVHKYSNGVNLSDEKEYNDIYRNSFANYFENNIMNLAMSDAIKSEFSVTIKDNLHKLCEYIDDKFENTLVRIK